jgi:hypothetical protein
MELQFKKGTKNTLPRWHGFCVIDKKLTLHYEVIKTDEKTFITNVSHLPKISITTGVYYQCESYLESLDDAKTAIEIFVKLVKKNPSGYYPEED